MEDIKKCLAPDCSRPAKVKCYCAKHYMQIKRTGRINDHTTKICRVEGCDSAHHAKGYCTRHYWQFLLKGVVTNSPAYRKCSVTGCGNKSRARGLCFKHYKQLRRGKLNL